MFEHLRSDIYGVFATPAWNALGVAAYPDNYQGAIATDSFVKLHIIPGTPVFDSYALKKSLSGAVIISIYVKAGKGDKEIFSIGDSIDGFFQGKTLQNGTQFGPSTINVLGLDRDDPSLYRGDHMITFKIIGE